jgi:hypothetical protein
MIDISRSCWKFGTSGAGYGSSWNPKTITGVRHPRPWPNFSGKRVVLPGFTFHRFGSDLECELESSTMKRYIAPLLGLWGLLLHAATWFIVCPALKVRTSIVDNSTKWPEDSRGQVVGRCDF